MRAKNNRFRIVAVVLGAVVLASLGWSFSFIINDSTDLPIKWRQGNVRIRIMADNTTALTDGLTRATSIHEAMLNTQRGWNRYLGDVQLVPQIEAAGEGEDGNDLNEIFFAAAPYNHDFDDNTLAITTSWSRGNERVEADMIFNTKFTWDSYRGNRSGSAIDIQRVALHELGHVLGLDHPDEDGQTVSAIMNSHVSNIDSLTTDDINGAQSMYGPPGVPANDNLSNATTVTLGSNNSATLKGFNTNATKESGEPNHAGDTGGHSVWWKWTPTTGGDASIDTRGSYFDTTLAVYTGSTVSSLTQVASQDDINPGVVQASFVSFVAKANTTYWIAVDGFKGTGAGDVADSAGITLNVLFTSSGGAVPAITTQPASLSVSAGNNAAFSVTATGTGTLSYQWYFGTAAIAGATGTVYNLTNVSSANAGIYYVTVSNANGSVTSAQATLTVTASTPAPAPGGGGGGGGGGGAPSVWFVAALGILGACRLLRRRA